MTLVVEPTPDFGDRLRAAAREAERETGRAEATSDEVTSSLTKRLVRAIVGFFLVALGIAALPLPGPGWLIVIIGLTLLPYAWAERTVRLIRRKIPGVPEDGHIPMSSWVIMGVLVITASVVSFLWGDDIVSWTKDNWNRRFA